MYYLHFTICVKC